MRNSLRSKRCQTSRTKYRAARTEGFVVLFVVVFAFGTRGKWGESKKVGGGGGCGQIQRVHAITRDETLKPSQTTTNQPSHVPLVITYNHVLCSISTIIQTHFKILSSSPRRNSLFQTTTLVAFRRTDTLSEILVRSKLLTDKQTNVTKGSFRCGKNCITCRYFTDGRTNYIFSATGEMRTIHDRVDCNSKNLVYMIHCLRCNK